MTGFSEDKGERAVPNLFRSALIAMSSDRSLPRRPEHCAPETEPYRRDRIAMSNLHRRGLYLESTATFSKKRLPLPAAPHKGCLALSVPPVRVRGLVFGST